MKNISETKFWLFIIILALSPAIVGILTSFTTKANSSIYRTGSTSYNNYTIDVWSIDESKVVVVKNPGVGISVTAL